VIEVIDGDDIFTVSWDNCDLVIETTTDFGMEVLPDAENMKFFEIVIEDRFCETDMEHFMSVRIRFDATLEPW
jgi:hypothetical protein